MKQIGMNAFMDSAVLYGTPKELGEKLSAFLKEKMNKITINAFSQSQSVSADGTVCVTATIIYTNFDKASVESAGFKREVVGFRRDIEDQEERQHTSQKQELD